MARQSAYAKGRYSMAECDLCGEEIPYLALHRLYKQYKNVQGKPARTDLWVCFQCTETDNRIKRLKTDPLALRHARPTERENLIVINPDANTTSPGAPYMIANSVQGSPPFVI